MVIPSARIVAPEMRSEFGPIPPALIPLGGRPAMRYILESAAPGSSAVIAGHEGLDLLQDAASRIVSLSVVDVGPTTSLGQTVLRALDGACELSGRRLVVNFADTLVSDLPAGGDAVVYRVQSDCYRWTTFSLDAEWGIGEITEKEVEKHGADLFPVFVGVFAFADADAFLECLSGALAASDAKLDPLYTAVASYV
ncbi:MAG: hypothetical protein ACRDL5_19165 [Solirubrobacteraceae bacterium]